MVTQERSVTTQNKIEFFFKNVNPFQLFSCVNTHFLRHCLTHSMNALCGALKTVTNLILNEALSNKIVVH